MSFACRVMMLAVALPIWLVPFIRAADSEVMTRTEDVIYGRKFGTALTMDVFTPKKEANGAAVVYVVSGGWFSSHCLSRPGAARSDWTRGSRTGASRRGPPLLRRPGRPESTTAWIEYKPL